jgi:hypothetical protein
MNLPFSTVFKDTHKKKIHSKLKGRETGFAIKIQASVPRIKEAYGLHDVVPKIHTFRESNAWLPGMELHMCTGIRTANYFRFNANIPELHKAKGVQYVEISWLLAMHHCPLISVGDYDDEGNVINKRDLKEANHQQMALNDGFDTVSDFYCYFNEDFSGKIVHWTDFRY